MAEAITVPKMLAIMLDESKRSRGDVTEKWKEYIRWLRGDQELEERADFQANTVTNYLFAQVMTEVPILTAGMPEINLIPEVDQLQEHADLIERLIKRIFVRNDLPQRQVELVTNGLTFGKAYMKPTWNRRMYGWAGDIMLQVPDSRTIFLEPGKMSLREANYLFECRNLNKLTLYRMYPDKKAAVDRLFLKNRTTEMMPVPVTIETDEYGRHPSAPGDPIDTTTEAYIVDVALGKPMDREIIEFVEAWFVDERTIEDIKRINKDKKIRNTDDQKLAYPSGRLVQFAGLEAFSDRPNPFPSFPYFEYNNYFIPGEQYSMSELEQAIPLQEQYNIRSNQIFDMLNFNIAPMRFYDSRSGLDPDELTNAPNDWVGVLDVDGIKQFDPPGVQAATFESLIKLQRDIETIFGVHEVTQGQVPGDVRSGFAVEQLQQAAQVRLRMKTRSIESMIVDMTRYLIRMIGLFYIPGIHYPENIDLTGITDDMFEVQIKAGVNLPASRFAQQQFIQWAFAQRIVDQQYVVEHSDLEGKEALIARMAPMWQAEQAMFLQQAGLMPAPQQAGGMGG